MRVGWLGRVAPPNRIDALLVAFAIDLTADREGGIQVHYVCGAIIMALVIYILFFTDVCDPLLN